MPTLLKIARNNFERVTKREDREDYEWAQYIIRLVFSEHERSNITEKEHQEIEELKEEIIRVVKKL